MEETKKIISDILKHNIHVSAFVYNNAGIAEREIEQLQAELDASNKALLNHREALSVFAKLRLLYESSACMRTEPVESAAKLMMKQCEEGLRIAEGNRKQEYIEQLQAENKRLKADLVCVNETLFKNTNACQQLQAELAKHRWIPVGEIPQKIDGWIEFIHASSAYGSIGGMCLGTYSNIKNIKRNYAYWKPIILPEGE